MRPAAPVPHGHQGLQFSHAAGAHASDSCTAPSPLCPALVEGARWPAKDLEPRRSSRFSGASSSGLRGGAAVARHSQR